MKKLIVGIVLGVIAMSAEVNAGVKPNESAEALAIALIAKHEGFQAEPYICPGGHWTIGYGFADPKLVAKKKMTRQEADYELGKIVRSELKFVNARLPKLNAKQKAAVVSFIFNFGRTKFLNSKYYAELQAGNYSKAKAELADWVHIKKVDKTGAVKVQVAQGLVKRRADEAKYLG